MSHRGLDISADQPDPINYQQVKDSDIEFVIIKDSESLSYTNPDDMADTLGFHNVGIHVFHYFVPHAGTSIPNQYQFAQIHNPGGQVEIDWEVSEGQTWAQLADQAKLALSTDKTGLLYCNLNWLDNMAYFSWPTRDDNRIWFADWGGSPQPDFHPLIQQTSGGTVPCPGINGPVDQDIFLGTEEQWATWIGLAYDSATAPPIKPVHTSVSITRTFPELYPLDTAFEWNKLLQLLLIWHLDVPFSTASGTWDHNTTVNVMTFQKRNNLPDNAIVDAATWEALLPNF